MGGTPERRSGSAQPNDMERDQSGGPFGGGVEFLATMLKGQQKQTELLEAILQEMRNEAVKKIAVQHQPLQSVKVEHDAGGEGSSDVLDERVQKLAVLKEIGSMQAGDTG